MKILKLIYDIITKGFMLILLGIVALVVILYCFVSLPPVQEKLKTIGEEELTRLLTAPVKIEKISFTPFNKLILENATVLDQRQDTIVGIEKLGAGISLTDLIFDE